MSKKIIMLGCVLLVSGCSTYNQPPPDYSKHERTVTSDKTEYEQNYKKGREEDTSNKVAYPAKTNVSKDKTTNRTVAKKTSVQEEKKEENYNDILTRYKLPSNTGGSRADNEDMSVGGKQTITIDAY